MIFQKIVDLCKGTREIAIYDDVMRKGQWIGINNGEAFYFLSNSKLNEHSLRGLLPAEGDWDILTYDSLEIFDTSDMKGYDEALRGFSPIQFNFEKEKFDVGITFTNEYIWLASRLFSPLSDISKKRALSLILRKTALDETYLIAMEGILTVAIIRPTDIRNSILYEELERIVKSWEIV